MITDLVGVFQVHGVWTRPVLPLLGVRHRGLDLHLGRHHARTRVEGRPAARAHRQPGGRFQVGAHGRRAAELRRWVLLNHPADEQATVNEFVFLFVETKQSSLWRRPVPNPSTSRRKFWAANLWPPSSFRDPIPWPRDPSG